MKATAVFVIVTFGLTYLIKNLGWLHADEAWLVGAVTGALVSYWVEPRPEQTYLRWTALTTLLVLGGYLFAFKVPKFFSDFIENPLISLFCFLIYLLACWAFRKWWIANSEAG